MKLQLRKYTLAVVLMLMPFLLFAHGKEEHVKDMWRIFPFEKTKENEKIKNFYELVNAYIDYKTFPPAEGEIPHVGTPSSIEKEFGEMSFDNHRVWFHWGFNKDPKTFQPLVSMVDKNVENGNISEDEKNEFWIVLKKEIKKRNKFLMEKWAKISGYRGLQGLSVLQRKQSNAFVTLLYSIHILGDHQTSKTDVIIDKKRLYGDIYNAIDNLAGKYNSNPQKAKSLKNKLRLVQGDPKLFLDKMEKEFTPFLYSLEGAGYNYKKKFSSLGYKLK